MEFFNLREVCGEAKLLLFKILAAAQGHPGGLILSSDGAF